MSLNAIQQFLKTTLDGLVIPDGVIAPVQAYVLPPVITDVGENPAIFIWGGDLDEQRATLPRGPGEKRVQHTLSLYVMFIAEHDPTVDQQFPILLDVIRATIRAIPLPVLLTDPTTGETSQLTDIGERIRQTYSTPVAMRTVEGMLQHNAALRLPIYEWFTA